MPGHAKSLSELSKSDLWSTTLVFPGLGFAGLALSTVPGLIMTPTPQAWIARSIVGSMIWLLSCWCAAGRLEELARRGSPLPLKADSHPWRAAAVLVTVVGALAAAATLAVIWAIGLSSKHHV